MIIVDTNVISEAMRQSPSQHVLDWLDAQLIDTLYLTTVTLAELRFGVASMPIGKRRTALQGSLEEELLPLFESRILPFDTDATVSYAALMSKARSAGQAISMADGYIAAIAKRYEMHVATRDTSPFDAAGIGTINPWEHNVSQ